VRGDLIAWVDPFEMCAATEAAMGREEGGAEPGGAMGGGRGLHPFPFPLNLSLLCPFPLKLSLIPYNPYQPVDVS
jgi:hypothetical protein